MNQDETDDLLASEFGGILMRRAAITLPIRERLQQDKIWINREGDEIPLEKIDARYARNIVRFFERRAKVLHAGECDHRLLEWCPFQGDQATWDFEQWQREPLDQDPLEWFHDQPLIRALDLIAYGRQHSGVM